MHAILAYPWFYTDGNACKKKKCTELSHILENMPGIWSGDLQPLEADSCYENEDFMLSGDHYVHGDFVHHTILVYMWSLLLD